MTWTRTTQTGSGKLAFRISIEGLPTEAVTHPAMTRVSSTLGNRVNGLSLRGVKLSQEANIPKATIEARGITITMADIDGAWTSVLNTAPTQETWLNAAATAADTSIIVSSTDGFPATGRLWLNSECMTYTGVTATTFTGLTRGAFNTLAQVHYLTTGAGLRAPLVTNQPVLYTGRRVRIFVYGTGDDLQGDGTQIWLGVLTGEPRMEAASWFLSADPISSILDQEIGADLGDPISVRGIWKQPGDGQITIWARKGSDPVVDSFLIDGSNAVSREVWLGPIPDTTGATTSMFFETQQAFITYLNAQLADAVAYFVVALGTTFKLYAVATADGYKFVISNGAIPDAVYIRTTGFSRIEPTFDGPQIAGFSANREVEVLPTGSFSLPGAGTAPRGSFKPSDSRGGYPSSPRLYLSGTTGIGSGVTDLSITWEGTSSEGTYTYAIERKDAVDRWVELRRESPARYRGAGRIGPWQFTSANPPEIKVGREYNDGSRSGTYTLMSAVQAANATDINLGSVPTLQAGDWNSTEWLASYSDVGRIGKNRRYTSLEPVKLSEYLSPDLQLAGRFLAFDSLGRLTIRKVRLASQTEGSVFRITRDNLITDDGMPVYERGAAGLYNSLEVNDGYNPSTDEYTQSPIIVRDVAAFGQSPVARTLKIEPKSANLDPPGPGENIAGARELAETYLGTFGGAYAYIHCVVPLTGLNGESTTLGSTVAISTKLLPNIGGTRGVEDLVGLVVSRNIDLYGARIELKILTSLARIGGYAFGSRVASQSNVTGNTWNVTVNSTYFAASETAETHLRVGDRLTVYRWNNATGGAVPGTVGGVSGNVVTITFDSTWTPSSDQWALAQRLAGDTSVTSNMKRYVYLAGTNARISYGDGSTAPAWVFSA